VGVGSVAVGVAVDVAVVDPVTVGGDSGTAVVVRVGKDGDVSNGVGEGDVVGVVAVGVGVGDAVVGSAVGVPVGEGVAVGDADVGEGVAVELAVGDAVEVAVGVAVGDAVGSDDGSPVGSVPGVEGDGTTGAGAWDSSASPFRTAWLLSAATGMAQRCAADASVAVPS
jgi:hypothetical protein